MHLPSILSRRPWRALLAFSLLAFPAFPPALASMPKPRTPLVELAVIDRDSGMPLPQYRHRGQAWLPGEPGRRYALRLRNHGPQRVLAVVSVDGVNVVDGRTADPRQAGYVLGPWQTLEIAGWRKSLEAVAGFVFVDPAASYAARTGRPGNVGVIGIAVFRERPLPASPIPRIAGAAPSARATDAHAEAAAEAASPAQDRAHDSGGASSGHRATHADMRPRLGTGHGSVESAPAYRTGFVREPAPAQLTELRYDTRHALLARGIDIAPHAPHRPHRDPAEPRAFPHHGFVPDPPCCNGPRP
ncbi:hypothetical protein B1992_09760 [Pseudoxanthomonas broegbernensis]|uniref:Uncharacterized protein n=1 Tax=Pseudoxanthomonas broegbernensis TaxID=83619 RepID=A0A7V8GLN2_9GAMM|nr:hypothetical protein [Pseudoxanthomonas broegbernensis]KAF1685982.1 hypothetical protein B1992_09760 [Pseudoxanthomonas broegbernensis]MBB6063764.1 hypothetical protein [Pseudoxanthomonas broegbernensis]